MSNPSDTAGERVSVLPPSLKFKGELSAQEDLLILGQVEGTISPSNPPCGTVTGSSSASSAAGTWRSSLALKRHWHESLTIP